jgi:hypothetical protein
MNGYRVFLEDSIAQLESLAVIEACLLNIDSLSHFVNGRGYVAIEDAGSAREFTTLLYKFKMYLVVSYGYKPHIDTWVDSCAWYYPIARQFAANKDRIDELKRQWHLFGNTNDGMEKEGPVALRARNNRINKRKQLLNELMLKPDLWVSDLRSIHIIAFIAGALDDGSGDNRTVCQGQVNFVTKIVARFDESLKRPTCEEKSNEIAAIIEWAMAHV